jgi:hypothetical protein
VETKSVDSDKSRRKKQAELSNKAKYLSLLVILTFVVGQVQYTYTSYFCTMLNKFLVSPSIAAANHNDNITDDACDDCQVRIDPASGHLFLEPNCFRVTSLEKSVVDNFVGSPVPDIHFTFTFTSFLSTPPAMETLFQNWATVPSANPPPLDLPTLYNNLRI